MGRHFQIGEVMFNLAFKWGVWWLKKISKMFSLSCFFLMIRRIQSLWKGKFSCVFGIDLVFSCIQTNYQWISNVKHLSRGLEAIAVCCPFSSCWPLAGSCPFISGNMGQMGTFHGPSTLKMSPWLALQDAVKPTETGPSTAASLTWEVSGFANIAEGAALLERGWTVLSPT